jgi:hypothetical protein
MDQFRVEEVPPERRADCVAPGIRTVIAELLAGPLPIGRDRDGRPLARRQAAEAGTR